MSTRCIRLAIFTVMAWGAVPLLVLDTAAQNQNGNSAASRKSQPANQTRQACAGRRRRQGGAENRADGTRKARPETAG